MPAFREFFYQPGVLVPGTPLRILKPLGYGGGGSVYEVWHETMQRELVLKVIHPELLLHRRRKQVEREAAILGRLEHENIVRILWADWTRDRPRTFYLVMEKLSGHPLSSLLHAAAQKREAIPIGFAINTAASVLRALAFAHGHGVVHCDVKPGNLFIHRERSERYVVKLLDFGIGRLVADTNTTGRAFRGTYHYASPEQLTGERLTPASDLYSLGVVLYEMLAGRGPFDELRNTIAIIKAHTQTPAPPVSRFRADLPPALVDLVARLLHKAPAERGNSCVDVAVELDDIRAAMQGARASTEPPDLMPWSQLPTMTIPNEPSAVDVCADTPVADGSEAFDGGRTPSPDSSRTSSDLSKIHLLGGPLPMPSLTGVASEFGARLNASSSRETVRFGAPDATAALRATAVQPEIASAPQRPLAMHQTSMKPTLRGPFVTPVAPLNAAPPKDAPLNPASLNVAPLNPAVAALARPAWLPTPATVLGSRAAAAVHIRSRGKPPDSAEPLVLTAPLITRVRDSVVLNFAVSLVVTLLASYALLLAVGRWRAVPERQAASATQPTSQAGAATHPLVTSEVARSRASSTRAPNDSSRISAPAPSASVSPASARTSAAKPVRRAPKQKPTPARRASDSSQLWFLPEY